MSKENKAVFRRVWEEVFNKGNLAAADELIAANMVNHTAGPEEQGSEGIKRLVTGLRAAFPDLHIAVEDMIAEGDKVMARTTQHGMHQGEFHGIPPTAKQVAQSQIHIVRIDEGKVAEHWCVLDNLGLMQQLGVVPPPGQSSR